jgi:hypothetical protein
MLFLPASAQTSQNGTSTAKNGSCRPVIALNSSRGRPVTEASAMSGVPSAPKATGAVLPINAMPADGKGLKPSAINMAAEIATGVPKPAAPSMNAPKLKAMSSAWIRRSLASPAIIVLTISNFPDRTVTS